MVQPNYDDMSTADLIAEAHATVGRILEAGKPAPDANPALALAGLVSLALPKVEIDWKFVSMAATALAKHAPNAFAD